MRPRGPPYWGQGNGSFRGFCTKVEVPDVHLERRHLQFPKQRRDAGRDAYDAGVRTGEQLANDMIAVPIGPDMRMAVVGAPSYFAKHKAPKTPQDLTAHRCINLRLPAYGGVYVWEFEKGSRQVNVRVDGQLVFNNIGLRLKAALAGFGLAFMPEDHVRDHIAKKKLVRVLDDWCPPFAGYHIY